MQIGPTEHRGHRELVVQSLLVRSEQKQAFLD